MSLLKGQTSPETGKEILMHGTIVDIDNNGTIITVWVKLDRADGAKKRGRTVPVHFDHRMFWHMVEARGSTRILHYGVTYTEGEGEPTLAFDDEQEVAV